MFNIVGCLVHAGTRGLISYHLFSSDLISNLTSSHRITSYLISHHILSLISPHLITLHLISSLISPHLIALHLISSLISSHYISSYLTSSPLITTYLISSSLFLSKGVTDDCVVQSTFVAWNVLLWSRGHEFNPLLRWTWGWVVLLLTLKVLNFWKFTCYCSLKPLWSGMGEVVPARTSPTLHPPSPPIVHQLSWLAL